jgi:hypothetical protein
MTARPVTGRQAEARRKIKAAHEALDFYIEQLAERHVKGGDVALDGGDGTDAEDLSLLQTAMSAVHARARVLQEEPTHGN